MALLLDGLQGDDARFTTVEGHDHCYHGVTEAVQAAEMHRAVDSLLVLDRYGHPLWQQTGPHRHGASLALDSERSRPYTEEEALRFLDRHRTLLHALPQHQDELKEGAALARPLFPVEMFPRLTQPGEAQPDTALALREDRAFGHGERDELARHDSLLNDLVPVVVGTGGAQAPHPVDEPAVPTRLRGSPRPQGTGYRNGRHPAWG